MIGLSIVCQGADTYDGRSMDRGRRARQLSFFRSCLQPHRWNTTRVSTRLGPAYATTPTIPLATHNRASHCSPGLVSSSRISWRKQTRCEFLSLIRSSPVQSSPVQGYQTHTLTQRKSDIPVWSVHFANRSLEWCATVKKILESAKYSFPIPKYVMRSARDHQTLCTAARDR